MGIARGINIEKEDLIFGYDSGYGVADPGESTRFYKGKPTTNLVSTSSAAFIHATSSGNAGSVVDAPEKGPGWKKVTITARGSNFRTVQMGSYVTLQSGVTYAQSFEADWGNLRGKGYTLTQDGSGGGSRNYFVNRNYNTGSTSNVSIDNSLNNGHIGMNINKSGGTHVHVPFIYNTGGTNTSGLNDFFYYKNLQLEEGTIPTPYVTGSRSNTSSLIDLKKTLSFDLSNLSFDSTGQPEFDGSDDVIPITSTNLGNGAWTIDAVIEQDAYGYNILSNSSGGPVTNGFGTNNNRIFYRHYNGSWQNRQGTSTTVDLNRKYYLTWVNKSNATMDMYVNGVKDSVSGFSSVTTNGGPVNAIGRNWFSYYNGHIYVIKYYKKSLTEQQVLNNFKAYKNRFNL
tara:strand:+ start:1897 stop:3090 length:1194 start_codon:yes stop_codon:yes gene_type:complete